MIKNIFMDLDCTLLPMNQDKFLEEYFGMVAAKVATLGLNVKEFMKHFSIGTHKMIENDGKITNELAFWAYMDQIYIDSNLREVLEAFYANEFKNLAHHVSTEPLAKIILTTLKNKGYQVVIATNPLFPKVATEERMRWNDLDYNDVIHVTTYENSSFSKPKNEYYLEIINKFGFDINECLMVGNDMEDDFSEISPLISTYLITDCLINKKNVPIIKNNGSLKNFYEYILSLPSLLEV